MGMVGWTSAHPPVGRMEWMRRAACQGSDAAPALFAELGSHPSHEDALRIQQAWVFCNGCPVVAECLTFGKRDRASGVYGHQILVEGVRTSIGHLLTPPKRKRAPRKKVSLSDDD